MEETAHKKVEHLFRNEYGKVVSILVNKYGTAHLEKVEDAVQEAFLKAMRLWAFKSVPDNPTAWLYRVAKNALIDVLRRDKKMSQDDTVFQHEKTGDDEELTSDKEIADSQLRMVFACCHPVLSQEHQIILSLKLIGGFSNKELADALLKNEEAVAKAFTRAKKKFRNEVQWLKVPVEMGLQSRLFTVLRVIYLLFSEGYSTTVGTSLLKKDICYEALRLALLLHKNKYCQHPNLEALIALMCFHASRFDARLNSEGGLVTLEHQDRSTYNNELVQIGIYHLENAGAQDKLPSNYHLEAAVSYHHCTAKTFEETDWKSILRLYDLQLQYYYSPMAALNRIVPYSKVHGPKRALKELYLLENTSNFESSGLFYAIKAELLLEIGNTKEYQPTLQKAIHLSQNELVKKHLKGKLMQ